VTAIASLEDLKAAQKEGLSIYAMLSALCALRYSHDLRLTSYGNIFTPYAMLYAIFVGLWLEERPPEQFKGEGG
jgi:hypothetical protein